jgi:hypothetical protein
MQYERCVQWLEYGFCCVESCPSLKLYAPHLQTTGRMRLQRLVSLVCPYSSVVERCTCNAPESRAVFTCKGLLFNPGWGHFFYRLPPRPPHGPKEEETVSHSSCLHYDHHVTNAMENAPVTILPWIFLPPIPITSARRWPRCRVSSTRIPSTHTSYPPPGSRLYRRGWRRIHRALIGEGLSWARWRGRRFC